MRTTGWFGLHSIADTQHTGARGWPGVPCCGNVGFADLFGARPAIFSLKKPRPMGQRGSDQTLAVLTAQR